MIIVDPHESFKDQWNTCALEGDGSSFLASWEWGNIQKREGRMMMRVALKEQEEFVGIATLIKQPLPFGLHYYYIPHGPIPIDTEQSDYSMSFFKNRIITQILLASKKVAREQGSIFLRVEPRIQKNFITNDGIPRDWKRIPVSSQPSTTRVIDLTQPLEAIMKGMRPKTRYNFGLAERKGVVVRNARSGEDFDQFFALLEETSVRQRFSIFPRSHYQHILSEFGDGRVSLFIAEYGTESLAAIMVIFFGDTATYLHGGSSEQKHEFMAPYLTQWHAMREAKARGMRHYDLWGVAPQGEKGHAWQGITRFKEGFGGEYVEWGGAFDYPLYPLRYWVYRLVTNMRRLWR